MQIVSGLGDVFNSDAPAGELPHNRPGNTPPRFTTNFNAGDYYTAFLYGRPVNPFIFHWTTEPNADPSAADSYPPNFTGDGFDSGGDPFRGQEGLRRAALKRNPVLLTPRATPAHAARQRPLVALMPALLLGDGVAARLRRGGASGRGRRRAAAADLHGAARAHTGGRLLPCGSGGSSGSCWRGASEGRQWGGLEERSGGRALPQLDTSEALGEALFRALLERDEALWAHAFVAPQAYAELVHVELEEARRFSDELQGESMRLWRLFEVERPSEVPQGGARSGVPAAGAEPGQRAQRPGQKS